MSFIDKIKDVFGKSKPQYMDGHEFTNLIFEAFRQQFPKIEVEIFEELHLNVTYYGQINSLYLDRLYKRYTERPVLQDEMVTNYINSLKDKYSAEEHHIELKNIIPVFQTKQWLVARPQQDQKNNALITDTFIGDLVILYAEKLENPNDQFVFLTTADFESIDISRNNLFSQAIKNLANSIGKIEIHQGPGTHMVVANGINESSLMLVDALLNRKNLPSIKGDLIAAIPALDTLLITGTKEAEGMKKTLELIEKVMQENDHPLTDQLFLHKDDVWQKYVT